MDITQLQYPIGKFSAKEFYTSEEISKNINRIYILPQQIESTISNFDNEKFDTPYRDGGWTVRQLIHHVADSHMNAFIRFKWTLTETNPVIKAYNEKLWAETPETTADPKLSIELLKALHLKWVELLKRLSATDLEKYFVHPDSKKEVKLKVLLAMYAWHGEHHLAHIVKLKERLGWL